MARTERLTRTRVRLMELIAHGLTNKEIAARLRLAEATIKWHVSTLLTMYDCV